jgi:DNA-binding transcriptional LysR family regulator
MDLNRIRAFVAVVEAGSFTAAAAELGTTKSVVSRALGGLERDLGIRLLQRTTRKIGLTSAGRSYYDDVHAAVSHVAAAGQRIKGMDREPRGLVRVTAPDLGGLLLMRIVRDFVACYPQISLELSLTPRLVDLVDERFDLAIRSGRLKSSSLIARRIGYQVSGLYASEAYLRRRGRPRSLRDLADHDCVLIRRPQTTDGSGAVWRLYKGESGHSVEVDGRVAVDDLTAACEAVRIGLGIGFIPRFPGVTDDWVRVLSQFASTRTPVSVVWPSKHLEPTRVVLFREFLIEALCAEEWSR